MQYFDHTLPLAPGLLFRDHGREEATRHRRHSRRDHWSSTRHVQTRFCSTLVGHVKKYSHACAPPLMRRNKIRVKGQIARGSRWPLIISLSAWISFVIFAFLVSFLSFLLPLWVCSRLFVSLSCPYFSSSFSVFVYCSNHLLNDFVWLLLLFI